MLKKLFILFLSVNFSLMLLSGCGTGEDEEVTAETTENETTEADGNEEENEDTEAGDVSEEEDTEEMEGTEGGNESAAGDFEELITYMEETTEGTANVLYESDQEQSHDMEGLTVTLNAYTLIELSDFHTNFNIPFDEETNGSVILAQYTVVNDTEDALHYMPSLSLEYVGADKIIDNYRQLLPEEQQLPVILSPNNDYTMEAGEEVTGYYTYPFGETRFEDVLAEGSADIQVPAPLTDFDDFSSSVGSEGRFTIALDDESASEQAETESQGFYEDKATADNMGDKTMLESEEGIGDSEDINNSTVTLEGYQFTEFEPNADEAPRFENFNEGVVLLTVKFLIDNGEETDISKSSTSSTLYLNEGQQWMINEGMLLNYTNNDTIEANEEGELLQIFTLDKEQYEKIWKDKSIEVKIGPLRDTEAGDISKGHEATFQLK